MGLFKIPVIAIKISQQRLFILMVCAASLSFDFSKQDKQTKKRSVRSRCNLDRIPEESALAPSHRNSRFKSRCGKHGFSWISHCRPRMLMLGKYHQRPSLLFFFWGTAKKETSAVRRFGKLPTLRENPEKKRETEKKKKLQEKKR